MLALIRSNQKAADRGEETYKKNPKQIPVLSIRGPPP